VTAVDQHNREIVANGKIWREKPLLRDIYRTFYARMAAELPAGDHGPIVELGSGMGHIKEQIPECITTDLVPNPWLDRQENAYSLTFPDDSIAAFLLFDVFHHFRYPGAVLRELHRTLRTGGRVILFEPDMSLLGRFIYGLFHHEPLKFRQPIAWESCCESILLRDDYYAAQGNAYRIFVRQEEPRRLKDWSIIRKERDAAISYVASGGFRGPQLYPRSLLPAMEFIDRLLHPLPSLFSTRLLVVLEKVCR
jgi:SAM-dependent methyltransferase